MIVAPEHGRNDDPNGIKDANAFYGYDHSDSNSQRIFNMMVGPVLTRICQLEMKIIKLVTLLILLQLLQRY